MRAGYPMPPDSRDWMADGASGGRVRQFPPEAPELATLARPRAIVPGSGADFGATDARASWRTDQDESGRPPGAGAHAGDAGRQGRRRSGRILALSGGGVLLAAAAAAAILGLGHGGGNPAPTLTTGVQPTQPGGAQDPLVPAPGTPTVTTRSIGGQQVEFSWHYNYSAPNDSFRVQVNGGSWKPVIPNKPDLVLSVAQGQPVCILVQVISAQGVGSPVSNQKCWPKS